MPHLIDLNDLTRSNIHTILEQAQHYQSSQIPHHQQTRQHQGLIAANLFFENSTRTRNSFEIAQHQHGMITLNPDIQHSALSKGESLCDMVLNLQAMGVRLFVIRHADTAQIDAITQVLNSDSALICAGSGCEHHPTQALTDLYTLMQYKPKIPPLSITIVGDIAHSRVASSLINSLIIMGAPDIRLVAPNAWQSPIQHRVVTHYDALTPALKGADVIYTLRVQKERIEGSKSLDFNTFHKNYGLTQERLCYAKPDCIVMHPGPINRGIEISDAVADGPQSVILEQVVNSIPARMAAIDFALNSH
jgi:aspartate carbamoyltransferase catalytic subunit